MSELSQSNMNHHVRARSVEFVPRQLRQNWTTGIFRDELALLESLTTGCRRIPDYVIETETQRAYKNPKLRSIHYLKHIEENRLGRCAYTPDQSPPKGIVPTWRDKPYPEAIPRFHLPKMPF